MTKSSAMQNIAELKDYYLSLNGFEKLFFPPELAKALSDNPSSSLEICKAFDEHVGFWRRFFLSPLRLFAKSEIFQFYKNTWVIEDYYENADHETCFNWIVEHNDLNLAAYCVNILRDLNLLLGKEITKNLDILKRWISNTNSNLKSVKDQLKILQNSGLVKKDNPEEFFTAVVEYVFLNSEEEQLIRDATIYIESIKHLTEMEIINDNNAKIYGKILLNNPKKMMECIIILNQLPIDASSVLNYSQRLSELRKFDNFLIFIQQCRGEGIDVNIKLLDDLLTTPPSTWNEYLSQIIDLKFFDAVDELPVGSYFDLEEGTYPDAMDTYSIESTTKFNLSSQKPFSFFKENSTKGNIGGGNNPAKNYELC